MAVSTHRYPLYEPFLRILLSSNIGVLAVTGRPQLSPHTVDHNTVQRARPLDVKVHLSTYNHNEWVFNRTVLCT